jgi:hypothetical protein
VKLNIEMTMANLIKRIALSSSRKAARDNRVRITDEFYTSDLSTSGRKTSAAGGTHTRRTSRMELASFGLKSTSAADPEGAARTVSFMPARDQIKVTRDVHIQSELVGGDRIEPVGESMHLKGSKPDEISVVQSKSVDDLTEGGSVKSGYMQKGDSDDERSLVIHQTKGTWHRLG